MAGEYVFLTYFCRMRMVSEEREAMSRESAKKCLPGLSVWEKYAYLCSTVFEGYHNKDYSVVKTLRGGRKSCPFLFAVRGKSVTFAAVF